MKIHSPKGSHSGKVDQTLVGWSNRLRASGMYDHAAQYDTDNVRDFELIYELNLPRYDGYILTPRQFLDTFNTLRTEFVYDKYYLILIPLLPHYNKYSLTDFHTLEQAKDFIEKNIKGNYSRYMLKISEFETNVYGGSIMSNDNIVVAEIARGIQSNVSRGTADVKTAILTSIKISTRYTTGDKTERGLLWRAINAIMKNNSLYDLSEKHYQIHYIRNYCFLKGYFEFAFTKHGDRKGLRLVFFDLKLKKIYYNL